VVVGHAGQGLDVADVARGIADAFAEDRPRPVVDELRDRVGALRGREADGDPLTGQEVGEQGVGGAVELWNRNDVAAQISDVDRRIVDRRLARAHAQRVESALEGGHASLQYRGGRIADAGVAIALDLEVEEGRSVVGAVEGVGDRLVDGHGHGFGRRIDLVPAMNGDRLASHAVTSDAGTASRLISRTTHSMSDSLVRKLVTHARTTGAPSPRRTSDIQAI